MKCMFGCLLDCKRVWAGSVASAKRGVDCVMLLRQECMQWPSSGGAGVLIDAGLPHGDLGCGRLVRGRIQVARLYILARCSRRIRSVFTSVKRHFRRHPAWRLVDHVVQPRVPFCGNARGIVVEDIRILNPPSLGPLLLLELLFGNLGTFVILVSSRVRSDTYSVTNFAFQKVEASQSGFHTIPLSFVENSAEDTHDRFENSGSGTVCITYV
mmetsp:Transcript_16581/g.28758  ORF Transcript_16581/g.28758 Transcript_16581/m.28758 type:complete len:212 (-) Transcript_16581:22-657(-)